jgi:hypothetical protein
MPRSFPTPGYPQPLDTSRLKVFPLGERKSLTSVDEILVDPDSNPPAGSALQREVISAAARQIMEARANNATVMLIYGAHLLRNGAALILDRMMSQGWVTHLATNGAGSIHDWEYAYLGRSTESVEQNVATGTFGAWDETARNIHLALFSGSLEEQGYGRSLGKFISEDGATFPEVSELRRLLSAEPDHPLSAARADLLQAMVRGYVLPGAHRVEHRWKQASILASAYRNQVPITIHPGIGYDIISNHPIFDGALIGRAGGVDFKIFGASLENLDGGVALSIGSAIMGPQVFEKSLSCVNNLRLQEGGNIVQGHSIFVVDIQDGGQWDWNQGEPPKSNPAYYLRFCKSFSRMGGKMQYVQCDNVAFIHQLYHALMAASED